MVGPPVDTEGGLSHPCIRIEYQNELLDQIVFLSNWNFWIKLIQFESNKNLITSTSLMFHDLQTFFPSKV